MKTQTVPVVGIAHRGGGFKQSRGRMLLIRVDLAVALVTGDHEIVLLRQSNQFLQSLPGHHRAGGVPRSADKQKLAGMPLFFSHRVKIRQKALTGIAIEQDGFGAR